MATLMSATSSNISQQHQLQHLHHPQQQQQQQQQQQLAYSSTNINVIAAAVAGGVVGSGGTNVSSISTNPIISSGSSRSSSNYHATNSAICQPNRPKINSPMPIPSIMPGSLNFPFPGSGISSNSATSESSQLMSGGNSSQPQHSSSLSLPTVPGFPNAASALFSGLTESMTAAYNQHANSVPGVYPTPPYFPGLTNPPIIRGDAPSPFYSPFMPNGLNAAAVSAAMGSRSEAPSIGSTPSSLLHMGAAGVSVPNSVANGYRPPCPLPPTPGTYLSFDPASWPSTQAAYAYAANGGYGLSLDGPHRKNATRESTATLKAWLQEHLKNPYPTKGEKIMLAIITKMTLTQVSTWFANARRRLKKDNKMTWTTVPGSGNSTSGSNHNTKESSGNLNTPNKSGKHHSATEKSSANTSPTKSTDKVAGVLNRSLDIGSPDGHDSGDDDDDDGSINGADISDLAGLSNSQNSFAYQQFKLSAIKHLINGSSDNVNNLESSGSTEVDLNYSSNNALLGCGGESHNFLPPSNISQSTPFFNSVLGDPHFPASMAQHQRLFPGLPFPFPSGGPVNCFAPSEGSSSAGPGMQSFMSPYYSAMSSSNSGSTVPSGGLFGNPSNHLQRPSIDNPLQSMFQSSIVPPSSGPFGNSFTGASAFLPGAGAPSFPPQIHLSSHPSSGLINGNQCSKPSDLYSLNHFFKSPFKAGNYGMSMDPSLVPGGSSGSIMNMTSGLLEQAASVNSQALA